MFDDPIIIVGTTPDYVLKVHYKYPGSALFLMDRAYRDDSDLKAIESAALVFSPHDQFGKTLLTLDGHLSVNGLSPRGVACFDCESLVLANRVALHKGLPFPPLEAILKARNKMESRRAWQKAGILCPDAAVASNLKETLAFFRLIEGDLVLKPLSGSGSELVFRCRNEKEVEAAVRVITQELSHRRSKPLYRAPPVFSGKRMPDPCRSWITEEFISGPEYSCDFFLHNGKVTLLRETEKIKAPDQTFGSILAYICPPCFPEKFDRDNFPAQLAEAAVSLGFAWGHFMVDYIIRDGRPVMIEMTPRPGGDSIPDLIEASTGRDMLGIHLDIMAGRYVPAEGGKEPEGPFASINLYANMEGIVERLDTTGLSSLPFIRKVVLKRKVGDMILFPPEDYDSRYLGYCIVSLKPALNPVIVQEILHGLLDVSILERQDKTVNMTGK